MFVGAIFKYMRLPNKDIPCLGFCYLNPARFTQIFNCRIDCAVNVMQFFK